MSTFAASVTIVDLPAGTTVSGAELFEAVQTTSGVGQSVQLSLTNMVKLVASTAFSWSQTQSFVTVNATTINATTVNATTLNIVPSLAPVSGGTTTGVVAFGSGPVGIYFGSGAPTITAGTGSLYLRTDGASNVTRMYVNKDGSTGWTGANTVS